MLADVRLAPDAALPLAEVVLYFSPRGMVVLAPLPGGIHRVVATVDDAPERPDAAYVQALLDERGPAARRAVVRSVVWGSRFRVHHRVAARYRAGRVLLAGDAAHLMPPFAGQALNAGLRDAVNLAWKIAAEVRGQAGDALVDSYEAERRPHAEQMVRLSHRIGQVVMSTSPLVTALRDAAVTALRLVPPAHRWLVGMKFMQQPHFTAGCIVPPAAGVPAAAAALVGRALPQPTVQREGGERAPLDPVLGSGWAVLRFAHGAAIEVQRAGGGRESVVDAGAGFAGLAGSGATLVVRPDRYVAAATSAAGERAALEALAACVPGLPALLEAGPQAKAAPAAFAMPARTL